MLRNRRRWLVATFVLIITAIAYVDRVNLSVAAPVLTEEFHTNAAVMGLLLAVAYATGSFLVPLGLAAALALLGALAWGIGMRSTPVAPTVPMPVKEFG
ncbi:hypothetical protein ACQP04_07365 [Pseudonocardia halophobica]|uniref:hypothetical protein n=1 Tax=Pseudonocardia halophobica TaxID=29401 RepID=UPI003D915FD1